MDEFYDWLEAQGLTRPRKSLFCAGRLAGNG